MSGDYKKCRNIAVIITKTINNFLGADLAVDDKNLDSLIDSLESNLTYFYKKEKTKESAYREYVRTTKNNG